jgi:hypothetical protein
MLAKWDHIVNQMMGINVHNIKEEVIVIQIMIPGAHRMVMIILLLGIVLHKIINSASKIME